MEKYFPNSELVQKKKDFIILKKKKIAENGYRGLESIFDLYKS